MEWRDLLKLQALSYASYYCNLSGFLHSADAAVGMTYGGTFSVFSVTVPFFRARNEYNPCSQNGTTPYDMSFRASDSESRNLPEWQVLSCGGSSLNVVDSSTPLCFGRNDISGGGFVLSTQVLFATLLGDESSPLRWVYRI